MSSAAFGIEAIQPSGLSDVAMPLYLVLACAADTMRVIPPKEKEEEDDDRSSYVRTPTVSEIEEIGQLEASLPYPCSTYHMDELSDEPLVFSCVIRVPLSGKNTLFSIGNEVVRIFNAREFNMQRFLDQTGFKDHKIIALDLGAGLDNFGMSRINFSGTLKVEAFSGGVADGKLVGVEEGEELEVQADKVLDALAVRRWQGHFFATLHLEGKFDLEEFKEVHKRIPLREGCAAFREGSRKDDPRGRGSSRGSDTSRSRESSRSLAEE